MLFKSSAHLLLWAFGIVVLIVLGLLAADVGLFGAATQERLRSCMSFLSKQYGVNRANIQLALQIVGLAFTILVGMLGFLRALHYAEVFLPQRVNDFIAIGDDKHLVERSSLIAPYAVRSLREAPSPMSDPSVLTKLAAFVGLDWRQRTTRRLNNGLGKIDDAISVIGNKMRSCEAQKSTVHLIRGLDLAAKAALMGSDSDVQRQKNHDALREFEEVLKLNENDLDGLEQAARQSRLLNSGAPALHYLKKMARAAATSNKPVLLARAMRFQAEIFEEHGTPVSLNNARSSDRGGD